MRARGVSSLGLHTSAEARESVMTTTRTLAIVDALRASDTDFEWYPTTDKMIARVIADMRGHAVHYDSFMDIGAGDGRVLVQMGNEWPSAKLFGIEKAPLLQQLQPIAVVPVGTDFHAQDLMGLPVDVIFSNPPYLEFEAWASRIIATAYANRVYLVMPERWEKSEAIAAALKARDAAARVILRDDFLEADRRSRAVVHVVCVTLTDGETRRYYGSNAPRQDPFDVWFDQNIDAFEKDQDISPDKAGEDLARIRGLRSIHDLVAAYTEDYDRMQDNYRAIFRLDYQILKELGVSKQGIRDAIKLKMKGLKNTYWAALFTHLDVITERLTTKTKKIFLDRLTGQQAVAFTEANCYAVALWAIKAANQYFDTQLVDVFKTLSTPEGVQNYKSNQRTWEKRGWRFNAHDDEFSHYKLDYRIVLDGYSAIAKPGSFSSSWDHPGGLHTSCHERIDDLIAVCGNLGFPIARSGAPSRVRAWTSNVWQDFTDAEGDIVFQAKAFMNGNLHFRFRPATIKALNVEAARLLGWIHAPSDVVAEMGYEQAEAERYFGANTLLKPSHVRLLSAPGE